MYYDFIAVVWFFVNKSKFIGTMNSVYYMALIFLFYKTRCLFSPYWFSVVDFYVCYFHSIPSNSKMIYRLFSFCFLRFFSIILRVDRCFLTLILSIFITFSVMALFLGEVFPVFLQNKFYFKDITFYWFIWRLLSFGIIFKENYWSQ